VDWRKFETELRVWGGKGVVLKEGKVKRWEMKEVVERVEESLRMVLERCKGRKKWERGRKRWWDSELEEKRREVRGLKERWKREKREEDKEEVKIERRKYRRMIEEKKARYWLEYLESLKRGEGFKFVKMDRTL